MIGRRTAGFLLGATLVGAAAIGLRAQANVEDQARRQLESGREFYRNGRYIEALKDFQTVAEGYPTSSVADDALLGDRALPARDSARSRDRALDRRPVDQEVRDVGLRADGLRGHGTRDARAGSVAGRSRLGARELRSRAAALPGERGRCAGALLRRRSRSTRRPAPAGAGSAARSRAAVSALDLGGARGAARSAFAGEQRRADRGDARAAARDSRLRFERRGRHGAGLEHHPVPSDDSSAGRERVRATRVAVSPARPASSATSNRFRSGPMAASASPRRGGILLLDDKGAVTRQAPATEPKQFTFDRRGLVTIFERSVLMRETDRGMQRMVLTAATPGRPEDPRGDHRRRAATTTGEYVRRRSQPPRGVQVQRRRPVRRGVRLRPRVAPCRQRHRRRRDARHRLEVRSSSRITQGRRW